MNAPPSEGWRAIARRARDSSLRKFDRSQISCLTLNQAVIAAASSGLIATARRRHSLASPRRFCSLSAMPRLKCAGAKIRAQFEGAAQRRLGLGVAPETQQRGRVVEQRAGEIGQKRDGAPSALQGLFERLLLD